VVTGAAFFSISELKMRGFEVLYEIAVFNSVFTLVKDANKF